MKPKDDIELRKAALLKMARNAVRAKHSIAADAELNTVLPAIEKAFNASVQTGTLPRVSDLLREFKVLADGAE